MNEINTTVYSGTSGLVLPVSKALYPAEFRDKSRLTYYASLFNSVEINSSFYKMPMISTVIKWAATVPVNFQFTFKVPKVITHSKDLFFNLENIHHFVQTVNYIGNKKGCLLVQFPPGLKVNKSDQLEKLLIDTRNANSKHSWKVAIEFRNPSWYVEDIYALLRQHEMSLVIHDLPASATPIISTASFMYLRFHGESGRYRGSYTDDFLYQHAQNVKAWKAEGKTVYIYFNNTMGDAVKNLQTINNFIQS